MNTSRIFPILVLAIFSACTPIKTGTLLVKSIKQEGIYEIYKISGDASLHFMSNTIGELNRGIPLIPGNYLLLADCSYETVSILPNQTTEIVAHSLSFKTPVEPSEGDRFDIQCTRYPQKHPPQYIRERFELLFFQKELDMLVGMQAIKLQIPSTNEQHSQHLQIPLSALRVEENPDKNAERTPYFVSPADEKTVLTQSQDFGKWQFLPAGSYTVTVNGSQKQVLLGESQVTSLKASYLKFESSSSVELNRYQSIRGEPYTAEINEHRAFLINTIYPLISESVRYRLDGALKAETLSLQEGSLTVVPLRSLEVSLDCGPWEWNCLGKKTVDLYEMDAPYPFLQSTTDLPILFNKENIQVKLGSSQLLRYAIPNQTRDIFLETGLLILKPKVSHKNGYLSLLARIEGDQKKITGQTYDLSYSRPTTLYLITGSYQLVHFYNVGIHAPGGGLVSSTQMGFTVKKGEQKEIEFEYYLSEEKYEQLQKHTTKQASKVRREKPFRMF